MRTIFNLVVIFKMNHGLIKSYYRMRKMERISQLDAEVGQLKEQNLQLVKEGESLRGELRHLKDTLEKHLESGECKLEVSRGRNPDSTC